jgi:hypothetical protein
MSDRRIEAPAYIIAIGLEGPVRLLTLGNERELSRLADWVFADNDRANLFLIALKTSGRLAERTDEDSGSP